MYLFFTVIIRCYYLLVSRPSEIIKIDETMFNPIEILAIKNIIY